MSRSRRNTSAPRPQSRHWALCALTALCVAASGCADKPIKATYVAEAPPPELFQGTDALIVSSEFTSNIHARDLVRGAGEGAGAAAGAWLGGLSHVPSSGSSGGVAEAALLAIILAGVPVAAVVGAARAHSGDEFDAAEKTYRAVPAEPVLLPSLAERIAKKVRTAAPARWSCVEAATPVRPDACPGAMRPLVFSVRTHLSTGAVAGRFDPDISFSVAVNGVLDREDQAPFATRWRYRSPAEDYFDLAENDGADLAKRLDAMLEKIASAVARDVFLDPKTSSREVWVTGPDAGLPVEPVIDEVWRVGTRGGH